MIKKSPAGALKSLKIAGIRPPGEVARFGPYELDFGRGELRCEGALEKLPFQPLIFLLVVVAMNGEIAERDLLESAIWADGHLPDNPERRIDHVAMRTRNEIRDDAKDPTYIETHTGSGYRLKMHITWSEATKPRGPKSMKVDDEILVEVMEASRGHNESERTAALNRGVRDELTVLLVEAPRFRVIDGRLPKGLGEARSPFIDTEPRLYLDTSIWSSADLPSFKVSVATENRDTLLVCIYGPPEARDSLELQSALAHGLRDMLAEALPRIVDSARAQGMKDLRQIKSFCKPEVLRKP